MKPFHEGQRAFRKPNFRQTKRGYILEGNPYEEDTKDYRDWEFGFSKAFYDNLEKVQSREGSGGVH